MPATFFKNEWVSTNGFKWIKADSDNDPFKTVVVRSVRSYKGDVNEPAGEVQFMKLVQLFRYVGENGEVEKEVWQDVPVDWGQK